MQVCAYAVTQGVNRTMGAGTTDFKPVYINDISTGIGIKNPNATGPSSLPLVPNPYLSTTYTTTVMMKDAKWAGSEDICGKMVLTNTYIDPDTHSSASQDVAAAVRNAVNTIQFKYALGLLNPNGEIGAIAKEAIQVAESNNQTISAKSVENRIVAIRSKMMAEITQEVRKQVSNDNAALLRKFKEKGWVMAGSLHRELAQIKDAIRSVTTTKTTYIQGSGSVSHLMTTGAVSTSVETIISSYNSLVTAIIKKNSETNNGVSTTGKPGFPSLQTDFSTDDFMDGGNSIKSMITKYFNYLPDKIVQGLVFYLAEDGTDPVMQVKNVGDWMAGVAETYMLTKANIKASLAGIGKTLESLSNQPVVGVASAVTSGFAAFLISLVEELSNIAWPGIMTLLYGGYFLGIWIPMVPYYVFALGVIGWMVQVIESMAAGSFWMVMHLTPERDDSFIGSQQQGYLLLMSLFARPPLMVLGVVASMAILTPAIRFVNAGFISAFRIIQADSITGLLSIAGFLLVYCVIILGVFMLVFSLPQTLPDRILRWIGAGISDLGEQGTMSRIEGGASGRAKAAALAGAAGMARSAQDRKEREARRANTGEEDSVRPEGHTK